MAWKTHEKTRALASAGSSRHQTAASYSALSAGERDDVIKAQGHWAPFGHRRIVSLGATATAAPSPARGSGSPQSASILARTASRKRTAALKSLPSARIALPICTPILLSRGNHCPPRNADRVPLITIGTTGMPASSATRKDPT
jgi:hypothetical protein